VGECFFVVVVVVVLLQLLADYLELKLGCYKGRSKTLRMYTVYYCYLSNAANC